LVAQDKGQLFLRHCSQMGVCDLT